MSLPLQHKEYLGSVRHWSNLKIGYEGETVWIKDLTPAQADSLQIKVIPYKELYYSAGPKLFPKDSLLPARTIPSLVWTPIERGLLVELPALNHNYFGLNEKVAMRLHRTEEEKDAYACFVRLEALESYIETAPANRLANITWVLVDEGYALLLGTPLLPVQGDVYWREGDFLLPAGYAFELPLLAEILRQLINPQNDHWIIWSKEGHYWKLPKDEVEPLSIGSFRASKTDKP